MAIDKPLISVIGQEARNRINLEEVVANCILENNLNLSALTGVLPPELIDIIRAVPIPIQETEDSFCWGFTQFTVKSTAIAIQGTPMALTAFKKV